MIKLKAYEADRVTMAHYFSKRLSSNAALHNKLEEKKV